MQIVAISHSRQSQKVWLKFDDSSYIPFKIDDLVVHGIKKFVDIEPDYYRQLQEASAKFVLTEYALRQIAISPKVSQILTQKLNIYSHNLSKKYNYPGQIVSSLVEVVVNEISDKGLLDKSAFIEYYVRRHSKMSQRQISYNLQTLGLEYRSTVSDLEVIKKLLSRKIRNLDLTDFNTKNKLIASFYRKGFAIDLVKTAIDELSKIK